MDNATATQQSAESILSFAFGGLSGFLNIYTFFVLQCHNIQMNKSALVLFKFQLLLDGIAGGLLIFHQFQLNFGLRQGLAHNILCQLLNRRSLIWIFYTASVYNVVAVSVQRWFITVYPFKQFRVFHSIVAALLSVLISILVNICHDILSLGLHFLNSDVCLLSSVFDNIVAQYVWFGLYYLLPTVIIIGFYAKVIYVLKRRPGIAQTKHHKVDVTKRSEYVILKNAVVISALFITLAGVNSWSYFMLAWNVFDPNEWFRHFRLFSHVCTMVNSASTPIVYYVFFPSIRKKALLYATFSKCCFRR